MESGIPGCGIWNPQTCNPESKTLLDYLTWGDRWTVSLTLFWLKTNATDKVLIQDPNCNFLICFHFKPQKCQTMSDQIQELPVNMFNWVLRDKEKCVISEHKSADGKQIIWGLKVSFAK